MIFRLGAFSLCAAVLCAGALANPAMDPQLQAFQKRAERFRAIITLPTFETTPAEVAATVKTTIREGNAALDRIGATPAARVTFDNTFRALDDASWRMGLAANRLSLLKETSEQAPLRDAATAAIKELQEWSVGLDYREDVYRVLQACAATHPSLQGEDEKLFVETLRDYRRAGLDLSKARRDQVEQMRKELSRLTTDFESNVTRAKKELRFTRTQLEGVPESFLEQTRQGDEYAVLANVTWHYVTVMENARDEAVRKQLMTERNNLARTENLPLLERILPLRDNIARELGYASWADYQTEIKMVKNARTAIDFLRELKTGLQPKFEAELAEFQKLKAAETGQAAATIQIWDWRYYANQLQKQKYAIDAEQLRVYFPYERVLDGMFRIYQGIFGLKFERFEPPCKWTGDLQLWGVSDDQTGEPLGLFYLDMFPREGKYNHFAQFGIIEGKRLENGQYQRPVCALVCNFPTPVKDRPSLLSHADVETLFHEFGHAMHTLLTRAQYGRFSGASVPRDFVEAPSQMLENWVWDQTVLDSFAADYRDPAKKIPAEILRQLKAARLATEGARYRRQLSFGLMDLMLHTRIHDANRAQAWPLSNEAMDEVFLPRIPDTAFAAYFGHLMGYDAGYYGYAWAEAIAADLATVFEKTPKGYFDPSAGRRLREEIYAVGDSRDVNVSIEKFLGRKRSLQPFLKKIGIE